MTDRDELEQTMESRNLQLSPHTDAKTSKLLLSVAESAALLGISRAYAYELVMSGQLPTVKIGRLRRIRPDDLATFVDSLETA